MAEATHIARPVRVYASQIIELTDGAVQGAYVARTADDMVHRLSPGMTARHTPVIGDYLVEQEDGYLYVNPREVFERKYRPLDDSPLTFDQQSGAIAALRKLADQMEEAGDAPDQCVIVYGTVGEPVVVHTITSSLEALGLLVLGQKIMGDVLIPEGGKTL